MREQLQDTKSYFILQEFISNGQYIVGNGSYTDGTKILGLGQTIKFCSACSRMSS